MTRTEVRQTARHCLLVLLFFSALFTIFFAPVLFTGHLLAPGDGLLYHLSFFRSEKVLWDTMLGGGFPMTADPQVMAWYPPSLLLSLLPGGWNLFVLSAYVMAGSFTYGYVYTLTDSKLSGLVSGTAYGTCGFMMAHLGHTAIIHVAAWLPLIVWSLEMLRRRFSPGWLAIGCTAVACCVLAGHLQIVVYVLLTCACYALALGWRAPVGRARYYLAASLLFLLGLGLASLQILPTMELAGLSTRSEYGFSDFASYSFPLNQLPMLIFPGVFGGLSRYGRPAYFGAWNLTEMAGYAGLLVLMLAGVGFAAARREAVSIFWLCAALAALLLALGDQTPLAHLIYRLPVISKFRVPARHFVEMTFAVSVLAGFGARAILAGKATKRLLLKVVAGAALVALAALLFLISKHSTEYVFGGGVARLNSLPWANAAVAVPLLLFTAGAFALVYWRGQPSSLARRALVLAVIVLDAASFGWFYSWQEFSPPGTVLTPPAFADRYGDSLRARGQRALPVRGARASMSETPPNLSRLWGVPAATAYGPLSLSRMSELLSMRADASVDPAWKNAEDRSLDLAAVRYVLLPGVEPARDESGASWDAENMGIWMGANCDPHPYRDAVRFDLPAPVRATTLGIVSRLACGPPLAEGEEVVRVSVRDTAGGVHVMNLLAGRDTSEWAYDCRTVKEQMKHGRAEVFSTFPAKMNEEPCEGHFYLARLDLGGLKEVAGVELRWVGRSGAITIEKLSWIDETGKTSVPVDSLTGADGRWRFAGEAGGARVYENLSAQPRAWLAKEVMALKPPEILQAIKTSRLPDGRRFDPARTALVEDSSPAMKDEADPSASVEVKEMSATVMEVQTSSASPSFLVTSDSFYPGWSATVDGAPTQVFRADYALRGMRVPPGRHTVRFEFRPKSFYYGAAVSAFSLLALAAFFLPPLLRRKPRA